MLLVPHGKCSPPLLVLPLGQGVPTHESSQACWLQSRARSLLLPWFAVTFLWDTGGRGELLRGQEERC